MALSGITLGQTIPRAQRQFSRLVASGLLNSRFWLALLSIAAASGVLLVALAYNGSRDQQPWAEGVFWLGFSLLVLPVLLRLTADSVPRNERISLLVVLSFGLYFVKVFYSPLMFTLPDELSHWRSAVNVLETGELFAPNPLLPISAYFPGLEIVVSAVSTLSGLTIFQVGIIIVAVARLVLVLALFLFYERISQSPRLAGLATFVYISNPHFTFFDAQFSYESLSITFIALALYAVLRWSQAAPALRFGLWLTTALSMAALAITHHVSSYVLVGLLGAWLIVGMLRRGRVNVHVQPLWALVLVLGTNLVWFMFVAHGITDYLGHPIMNAVQETAQLLMGEREPRTLFSGSTTTVPLWVRALSIGSVGLIALGILRGAWYISQKQRRSVLALTLALVSFAYFGFQVARFSPLGLQVASRMSPFIYLAIGYAVGIALLHIALARIGITPRVRWLRPLHRAADRVNRALRGAPRWFWKSGVFAVLSVVFMGTTAAGLAAWPLPGAYKYDVYTAVVDTQAIKAATWAHAWLGANNRFGAEEFNLIILGSYGSQRALTELADNAWLTPMVFRAGQFSTTEIQTLKDLSVEYLMVDRRTRTTLVEPPADSTSVKPASITRLDRVSGVSRVYDSGDIQLYDVRFLPDEP